MYQSMKHKVKNAAVTICGKTGLVISGLMATGTVMAADHSTAIAAAGADGVTNLSAAVTAILSIAAVIVGVGLVIKFLQKS